MTLKVDRSAVRDVLRSAELADELLEDGWMVARAAADLASKRTGDGAKSIRAEVGSRRGDEVEVRVSWDRDYFYMLWVETGNEHQSPQPFLRPAAARFQ